MRLYRLAGDNRFRKVDIHFAAYSKLALQVYARFDRKTGPRHQPSIVLRLEVVHICGIAMVLLVNGMPGTMQEEFAITRLGYGIPGTIIHLPAGQALTRIGLLHKLNRRIAAIPHDLKNSFMRVGHVTSDKARPRSRNVIIDGMHDLFLCPNVDEQEIAFVHWEIVLTVRLVMRIGTMRVDGNNRAMR